MGGAIAILNWEEKGPCMEAWRALDENEYEHPNIAVSKTRFFQHPVAALNVLQGLSLEMWRGVTPRYS